MKSLLSVSMILLALALGACGDDNNDSASTSDTVATTGTTTTGKTTSEDSPKSKTTTDSKSESDSNDSKSKSSESESSKSKSGDSDSSTTNSGKGAPSTVNKNAGKSKDVYTQQSAEDLGSQTVARKICQGFLPDRTVKELKRGKTTKQEVAKEYAQGWPAKKRPYAYKGCLQGLRAREAASK